MSAVEPAGSGAGRKRSEAAIVVQESAEGPGQAVQEAEAGKGTGASQADESPACQETVSTQGCSASPVTVTPFPVGRHTKGTVQHAGP